MNAACEVTVGIPTFRSGAFIDRTLSCARAQTHAALRIVVSIDDADAQTVAICRRHQQEDKRVEVLEQRRRLGWSANTNEVLARFETPFGFIYFHDDVIAPDYVERLVQALLQRPDAASAHCDLVEFGLVEQLRPAHGYAGPLGRRLADFMLTRRGTTLRSLLRLDDALRKLRFPRIAGDGPPAALLFQLEMLAAGPAVPVHAPLYRRWQREGSLTRSSRWLPQDWPAFVHAQQQLAQGLCRLIDQTCADATQHRLAMHAALLMQRLLVRGEEVRTRRGVCLDVGAVHPRYASVEHPIGADEEFMCWASAAVRRAEALEAMIRRPAHHGPEAVPR